MAAEERDHGGKERKMATEKRNGGGQERDGRGVEGGNRRGKGPQFKKAMKNLLNGSWINREQ
jgi:hypothetical protein